MHNQSAGSGSELFCDLDGFTPLGLDMNSGHSDTPEHTHWEPVHTCQTSPHDSDPTGRLQKRSLFRCICVCAGIFMLRFYRDLFSLNWLMFSYKLHHNVLFLCFKRLDSEDYLCVQLLPGDTFQFASVIHITKAS